MTVAADGDLPALVLSVPTGDDLNRITEICQDADIQEWTFVPRNYQRSDAEFFVEQVVAKGWSEGRELTWAIREADAGAPPDLVGMLGITLSGPENARTGEVGYWLAAAARGRGTMTRAVAALIDTAFDPSGPLALSALRWRCDIHETSHGPVPNWASWKVAWSLGFQREGRVRRFLPNDGRLHDGWIATLLPEDPRSALVSSATHTLAEVLSAVPESSRNLPSLEGVEIVAQPHCHHYSVMGWDTDQALLESLGARVTRLEGCCGLAGNFGMEAGHYDLSVAVASHSLLPSLSAQPDAVYLADGFSCRTQAAQLAGRGGVHLATLLARRST